MTFHAVRGIEARPRRERRRLLRQRVEHDAERLGNGAPQLIHPRSQRLRRLEGTDAGDERLEQRLGPNAGRFGERGGEIPGLIEEENRLVELILRHDPPAGHPQRILVNRDCRYHGHTPPQAGRVVLALKHRGHGQQNRPDRECGNPTTANETHSQLR